MSENHAQDMSHVILEGARKDRDRAERRAEQSERVVAALVRKYGELAHGNGYRVALTEQELTEMPGVLSVQLDPNSGALLIRFRPE